MIEGTLRYYSRITFSLLFVLVTNSPLADHLVPPVISIIIDDIGYRNIDDLNALKLPGPITYAVMPHAPHSLKISEMADQSGKNIILHLPMEAIENDKNRYLGPGGLKLDMTENQFMATLSNNIQSIPNVIGVNNHMGSLLTMHTEQMEWLMDYLQIRKIFYIDSMTSRSTVTSDIAHRKDVPYLKRDVFLDNLRDMKYINSQFDKLIKIAKRKGTAIAIGHPHPETIEVLNDNLSKLDEYGVKLISLADMLNINHEYVVNNFTLYE